MQTPNLSLPHTLGVIEFSRLAPSSQRLFRVNANIPIGEALEAVSNLQFYANQLTLDAALSEDGERFSWAAYHLGEMAKALIDDVTQAMLYPKPTS